MRFRPHFTIRDLFWLTLVVALVVHWWVTHPSAAQTDLWEVVQINGTTFVKDHQSGQIVKTIPNAYGLIVYGNHLAAAKETFYLPTQLALDGQYLNDRYPGVPVPTPLLSAGNDDSADTESK